MGGRGKGGGGCNARVEKLREARSFSRLLRMSLQDLGFRASGSLKF